MVMINKLLIVFVITLLLLCLFCWFWERRERRIIKALREEVQQLIRRGADPSSSEFLAIVGFLNEAEFYCGLWRFDLESKSRTEAALKLSVQHLVVKPHYRIGPNDLGTDSSRNGS